MNKHKRQKPKPTPPKRKRRKPTLDEMEAIETADWVEDRRKRERRSKQT